MAERGRILDGGDLRLELLVTAAESDGALHEMRATWRPRDTFPPAHLHPQQEERFHVLEGELVLRVEGRERWLPAGETAAVPAGRVHQVRNPGDLPAVGIWQTRPALRTAEFLEAMMAARATGDPDGLLRAMEEFDDVVRLASQPETTT